MEQLDPAQRRFIAVLEAASEGLRGGQLFLWNEAARKVEALLACPAAFEGEAFALVSPPAPLHSVLLGICARVHQTGQVWQLHVMCICVQRQ